MISENDELTIFDPTYTWKKTTLVPGEFEIRKLLLQVFNEGKCVYDSPKLSEICAYCREEMSTLWDETKRLVNPHEVYVDLSDKLYELKNELLGSIK